MLEIEINLENEKMTLPTDKKISIEEKVCKKNLRIIENTNNKEADLVILDSLDEINSIYTLNNILSNYAQFNDSDQQKLVFYYNLKGIENTNELNQAFFNLDIVKHKKNIKSYTQLLINSTDIFDFTLLEELVNLDLLGEVVAKKDHGVITNDGYYYINKKEWINEEI